MPINIIYYSGFKFATSTFVLSTLDIEQGKLINIIIQYVPCFFIYLCNVVVRVSFIVEKSFTNFITSNTVSLHIVPRMSVRNFTAIYNNDGNSINIFCSLLFFFLIILFTMSEILHVRV